MKTEFGKKCDELEVLHSGIVRSAAMLDCIVCSMVEAGSGSTTETALLGVMDYLDHIAEDLDTLIGELLRLVHTNTPVAS